jgi:thiamine-phosphate pyrophosphorylase
MPAPRLLAILDLEIAASRGLEPARLLDLWLGAGIRDLLVRSTLRASSPLLAAAELATARAHQVGGRVFVSDRVDVALAAAADGVQLPSAGLPLDATLRLLALGGRATVVGRSVHGLQDDLDDPRYAWLTAAPVFDPTSKTARSSALGLEGLAEIVAVSAVPVLALGGLSPDRIAAIARCGAHGAAVLGGLTTADPGYISEFVSAADLAWPAGEL